MLDAVCLIREYEKNGFVVKIYYPKLDEVQKLAGDAEIKERILRIAEKCEGENRNE